MSTYELMPQAQQDLTDLYDYIYQSSPQNAAAVAIALTRGMERIGRAPGIGHRREDLTGLPVRFLTVKSFLLVYDPGTRPVKIVAVVRGTRSVRAILGG